MIDIHLRKIIANALSPLSVTNEISKVMLTYKMVDGIKNTSSISDAMRAVLEYDIAIQEVLVTRLVEELFKYSNGTLSVVPINNN